MTSFIVRYSGRGTGVLRTETDEELRFNVTAGRGGAVTSEERARL